MRKKTTLSQYNPDHDQLESMDTHKNVADMAASKFKNMLNRFHKMVIMQKSEIFFSPQTSPTNPTSSSSGSCQYSPRARTGQ